MAKHSVPRRPITPRDDNKFVVSRMGMATKPLLTQSSDPAVACAKREELALTRTCHAKTIPWQISSKKVGAAHPKGVDGGMRYFATSYSGSGASDMESSASTGSTRRNSNAPASEHSERDPLSGVAAGIPGGEFMVRGGFPPGCRMDVAPGFKIRRTSGL